MSGKFTMLACLSFALAACTGSDGALYAQHTEFTVTTVGQFDEPWALEFLPDGRLLISEVGGALKLLNSDGSVGEITGLPDVSHGGQGGLGDVALHPDYSDNGIIYLSFAESGLGDTRGAAVARAVLTEADGAGYLSGVEVIWRQYPKVVGSGHYGHRLTFDDEGYLWISSGDRQKFTPSQDMQSNMGKILRLHDDGSIPDDNPFVDFISVDPFVDDNGVYGQIWSLGHRNPLGLAFDGSGRLWNIEMGPMGGDELNLVRRGANYGYPIVSNGDHYDGRDIPDHHTRPEFAAPAVFWNPVISPSSLMFYSGSEFPDWRGDAFVGGLSSESLVRIEFDGESAREAQRFDMGRRIRAVEQGPDGAIWLLEGGRPGRGGEGYLLKLTAPTP